MAETKKATKKKVAKKETTQALQPWDGSLTRSVAEKCDLDPERLWRLLTRQIIQVKRGDPPPTNEEAAMVLWTMRDLDLRPVLGEMHAWRQEGRMCVMVGYQGWVKKANEQKGFQGVTYDEYGEMVKSPDGQGKNCWCFITASCRSLGRQPTTITAFLEEWYVPQRAGNKPGEWQRRTKNRLRQKAYTLVVREHYGFAMLDETDYEIMVSMQDPSAGAAEGTVQRQRDLVDKISQARKKSAPKDGVAASPPPTPPTEDADFEPIAEEPPLASLVSQPEGATPDGEPIEELDLCQECASLAAGRCDACGYLFCEEHLVNGELCNQCVDLALAAEQQQAQEE